MSQWLALAVAASLAVYATFTTTILIQVSNEHKAEHVALLCFDYQGQVTMSNTFKECHRVAIRELHTHSH